MMLTCTKSLARKNPICHYSEYEEEEYHISSRCVDSVVTVVSANQLLYSTPVQLFMNDAVSTIEWHLVERTWHKLNIIFMSMFSFVYKQQHPEKPNISRERFNFFNIIPILLVHYDLWLNRFNN